MNPSSKPERRIELSWQDVERLVVELKPRLLAAGPFDAILCVTRGGLIPAGLISELLDLRNVMAASVVFFCGPWQTERRPLFWQFPSTDDLRGKRLLVVDDVWADGELPMAVKTRAIAAGAKPYVVVLHYRRRQSHFPNDGPDFFAAETDDWLVYPWERLAD
ncbi:MAG: phosphoribosyltransferase family protein [Bacillota bacterium]|nr:phosphoribosyltransferase family protein [Bacillota bacterium]